MKSKKTALLTTFILGAFGGQHFYLGNRNKGLLYLLFCWTGIPAVLAIFFFIKLVLTSELEFDRQYNAAPNSSSEDDNNQEQMMKKPENLGDVIKGIKATWNDPKSRKKILKKAFLKNFLE